MFVVEAIVTSSTSSLISSASSSDSSASLTRSTTSLPWRQRVGNQRDWVWRGWQVRYTYLRSQVAELSAQVGAEPEAQSEPSFDPPTSPPPHLPTPAESTPMLLLHGFGASIGQWRHNLEALSQQHTVYALDLLGFGASEKATAPYGPGFWADQVYDFWSTFIRQPVVLVGNSLGSLVSLTVAAKYPEMVRGLVMINLPDSSVLESPVWAKHAIAALAIGSRPIVGLAKGLFTSPVVFNPFFRVIRSPRLIRLWVKQAYTNPEVITEELLEILSQPAFDRGAAAALRAMIDPKTTVRENYTAKTVLPTLTMPMLLLWGDRDLMVPSKLAPLFVQCNPRLTLIEIANAGHCPHDERPEEVNGILLNWMAAEVAGQN
jgi:pimeloyl-ACP methyl ester carboxylesterase